LLLALSKGIVLKAQLLKTLPEIGHKYEFAGPREIRILLYGHYRIAYLVKPENSIDILGIFHGALSIERYLV
jgi:toxin ParE1/3/4